MKSRLEIKENAKMAFAAQRSVGILLFLLPLLITMAVTFLTTRFDMPYPIPQEFDAYASTYYRYLPSFNPAITLFELFWIPFGVSIMGGYTQIYLHIQTRVGDVIAGVNHNFGRKLGGMMLVNIFAFLWSLLLIIPGIIKAISYSMTPYLLAEYPELTALQAIDLSKRMTMGHKMDLFVMELSFLGWALLVPITFGIAGLYVGPYMSTTYAGYYEELKRTAIESGAISPEEFPRSLFE